jgi:flagellar motor switch protein FliM
VITASTLASSSDGSATGRGSGHRRASAAEPRPYDFRRPSKLNREHVRNLQIAYETFSRQFTTILTSTLRVFSMVELIAVTQMAYGDYIDSLPSPSFMVLASIEPLAGTAVLQLPHETAMLCIDRLLGGPGADDQPVRPLTDIETELMRGLSQRLMHELRYAFEGLAHLEPAVIGLQSNPQFAQVTAASDSVVLASFEMRVGDQEGAATLAMPFTALHPVLEAASTSKRIDRRDVAVRSAAAMRSRLSDVAVDVTVQFSTVVLNPNQILGLQVGDVLPLGQPTSYPLQVTSSGVTCAYAVPGSSGKNLACLIVEPPEHVEGTISR